MEKLKKIFNLKTLPWIIVGVLVIVVAVFAVMLFSDNNDAANNDGVITQEQPEQIDNNITQPEPEEVQESLGSWSLPPNRAAITGNPVDVWSFYRGAIDNMVPFIHPDDFTGADTWGIGTFFRTGSVAVGLNSGFYELFSQGTDEYPIIRFTAPGTGLYEIAPISIERRDGWDDGMGEPRLFIALNGEQIAYSEPVPGGAGTTFRPESVILAQGDTLEFFMPSMDGSVDPLLNNITITHVPLLAGMKIPVNIVAGNALASTFTGNDINLSEISGLFAASSGAGPRTYTIEAGGTGAGTINGDILTVTSIGTFYISVQTASTETHAESASDSAALLTVTDGQIFDPKNPHRPGGYWLLPFEFVVEHTIDGVTLAFNNETGDLIGVDNGTTRLHMEGGFVDVGIADSNASENDAIRYGSLARDTIAYQEYNTLAAWALPSASGFNTSPSLIKPSGVIATVSNGVLVTNEISWTNNDMDKAVRIETLYEIKNGIVEISATITNISGDMRIFNGVTFALKNIRVYEDSVHRFPGSRPAGEHPSTSGNRSTNYASPVTFVESGDRFISFMFINEDEKWVTRTIGAAGNRFNVINASATLSRLNNNESMRVGVGYIQINQPGTERTDALLAIRDFYASKGWVAPTDGVRDGPIYSGYPAGTTDGIFGLRSDHMPRRLGDRNDFMWFNGPADGNFENSTRHLDHWAPRIYDIAAMGFEIMWLLPLFEHPGSDLYNPNNMENIDARFGGNEAIAPGSAFRRALDSTGIIYLTDYVPHGPRWDGFETNPWFANHPYRFAWIATNLDGNPRNVPEWRCVALDYANPQYLEYMRNLAYRHVTEHGISGARIDAVMDTRPNWTPAPGNRPSNANMRGSSLMSAAIRQGILDAGVAPANLPETFHPVPFYAPHTDFFYDMSFTEFLYDIRHRDAVYFATEIAKFLEMQTLVNPKGQLNARFLANHDTVAPWYANFPQHRAWAVFADEPIPFAHPGGPLPGGLERSRALWVLISTIDGVPKIYQGDELFDNDIFFRDLFAARRRYLGTSYDIRYIHDENSQIIVFERFNDDNQRRLVMINLGNTQASRDLSGAAIGGNVITSEGLNMRAVYTNDGTARGETNPVTVNGSVITLEPFGSVIFEILN